MPLNRTIYSAERGVISKQITLSGKTITLNTNKVNTILGRYFDDILEMKSIIGDFENVGLGETIGGINILNKPNHYEYLNAEQWWNQWNKNWLERAVNRGDDIYLATIHSQKGEVINVFGDLQGAYAYELRYLVQKKYKPINISDDLWKIYLSWF